MVEHEGWPVAAAQEGDREDGRGIEVNTLIEVMKRDHQVFHRDEDTQRYHVTENVKVSLLAAAKEYEEQNPDQTCSRQPQPLTYELGVQAMPTIHDAGDEEEAAEIGRASCRERV